MYIIVTTVPSMGTMAECQCDSAAGSLDDIKWEKVSKEQHTIFTRTQHHNLVHVFLAQRNTSDAPYFIVKTLLYIRSLALSGVAMLNAQRTCTVTRIHNQ